MEDVDQIFVYGVFITLLDDIFDLRNQICKIFKESALTYKLLIDQTWNLSYLVQEVNDRKWHLDDIDLEFTEHSLEFSDTQCHQIH